MAVLLESPWYQEILKKGRQEARQEARQEGLRQGILWAIEFGLELKFGSSGLELMPEISQIQDVDVLRAIQEGLRTINSLDELREIYRVSED